MRSDNTSTNTEMYIERVYNLGQVKIREIQESLSKAQSHAGSNYGSPMTVKSKKVRSVLNDEFGIKSFNHRNTSENMSHNVDMNSSHMTRRHKGLSNKGTSRLKALSKE